MADVAIASPTWKPRVFGIPPDLAAAVGPGAVLNVPVGRGRRIVEGVCLRTSTLPWDHTRPLIATAQSPAFRLAPQLADLAEWLSSYYACALWKAVTAMLPVTTRTARTRRVVYVEPAGEAPATATAAQARLLATLGATPQPRIALLRAAGVGAAVLRKLVGQGVVRLVTRAELVPDAPFAPVTLDPTPEDQFALTGAQQEALSQITALLAQPTFRVFLLFGVPGSGKTEVYVRAIRQVTAQGRQAIVLIPEIALATQLATRLARRFDRAAVLHSQLSERTRRETLAAIARGAVDVVIGTRTAVFAPCPRLGLLIVDEEQEDSFKNLGAPYYHARDVAIKRGQLEQVPVVLGSATPALESWHNAQQRSHYTILPLPERIPGAALPRVCLAPQPEDDSELGVLSQELSAALATTLAAGRQAILLHNRRGYATHLRCIQCGLLVTCERCGSPLIYHRTGAALKCHRCGFKRDVPTHCLDDSCHGKLTAGNPGIQRLEERLLADFPQARLLRLDRDTMRRRGDYEAALHAFEAGEAHVLIGTQMVAKGLDFPNVGLVGVLDGDARLALPDFRAAERVFQLVVQVVGRAGRQAHESLAVVQARRSSPVLRAALALDYAAFAEAELVTRRRFGLPPFGGLVRIICADEDGTRAQRAAAALQTDLAAQAMQISAHLRVDPAEACPVPRLRGLRRFQVLVRGPRDGSLTRLIATAHDAGLLWPRIARCTIDVDPIDLM